MTNNIELTNEDCMEMMTRYPDGHFDLAIVDPPYGINYENGGEYFNKYQSKKWDDKIPNKGYFIELFRVSKNQIIWGGNYFHLPPTRCVLAWTKTVEIQNRTFSEWEMAWTSFKTIARYYNLKPFQKGGNRIHPTQKPVKLYEWLLQNYSKPGDKIIDTHGGSMSIALAVHNVNQLEKMDLSLTLCELDKDYYDAGVKRYDQHIRQQFLF